MNDHDVGRLAELLLARYRMEERPDPATDAAVRAALRREQVGSVCRGRMFTGVAATIMAATTLVAIVWLRDPVPSICRDLTCIPPGSVAAYQHQRRLESRLDRSTIVAPSPSPAAPPSVPAAELRDPSVQLLKTAGDLLEARRFREAVETLRACALVVGDDALAEECDFLRIRALCGAGDRVMAEREIAEFKRRWSGSLHWPRIEAGCASMLHPENAKQIISGHHDKEFPPGGSIWLPTAPEAARNE